MANDTIRPGDDTIRPGDLILVNASWRAEGQGLYVVTSVADDDSIGAAEPHELHKTLSIARKDIVSVYSASQKHG